MQKEIVDKLGTILAGPIDSEYKVVYLLAETRKLFEKRQQRMPFALKLYCHWALHVDLEYEGTTLRFLKQVDNYVASVLAGNRDVAGESRMLREFIFLETFKNEFAQFLRSHDLPTKVCDESPSWQEFLKHYAGVIENGSLSLNANHQQRRLTLVSGLVFKKGEAAKPNCYLPFSLDWTILLLDKRKLTVEVTASSPNGNEMILNVIRLH